ncbi:MAG: hypothetical protein JWM76_483 [Pseudonocardiales bacterium]|nr:hypothetical protein [Pseudonocardiales bacterium]
MSGRHVTPPNPPKPRRARFGSRSRSDVVVIATLLAVAAAVFAGVVAVVVGRGSGEASASGCGRQLTLNVAASPAIAAPLSKIATAWNAQNADREDQCTRVEVTPAADSTAEATLASGGGDQSIWIPDSSLWAQRLISDLARTGGSTVSAQVAASIANSPIIMVTPPARTDSIAPIVADSVTQLAAIGSRPFTVVDPVKNSEGLLSLLSLQADLSPNGPSVPTAASGAQPAPDARGLLAMMVRLGQSNLASPDAGFAQLGSASPVSFAASEQAVIEHNRPVSRPVATAVYPDGAVPALDFPVVTLRRAGDAPAMSAVVADFQRSLRAIEGQRVLAAAGFRNPAGDPISGANPGDPGSAATSVLPQPVSAAAENILRLWSAAKAASHTLAVIDVSGSMAAPAGNGQTRIQLAATAAAGALTSFPDDSAFGLWAFSSSDNGGTPWTALAPVTALGAPSNGSTQREQLVAAAGQLPGLVTDGHTALYDTTLAAFQEVRNTYDPAKVNSVVLLTDGDNDYPSGITLDTLLAQLRLLVDSARPVAIIAVGIGDQADITTLQQITAVTGGKTYSVKNPADVGGVFLDAVLQRQCRPSC